MTTVALTPFHADTNNTLYTSATARTTRHFGYTYPEVVEWNVSSTQLSSNVRTNLNKLYNPTDSLSTRSLSHRRPNYHGRPRYSRGSGRSYGHQLGNVTKEFQYFVNVRVDKYVLQLLSLFTPIMHSMFISQQTLPSLLCPSDQDTP